MADINSSATQLTMFLPGGDPSGIRIAEIGGASIKAYAFHKSLYGQVLQKYGDQISRPGVYVLYGEDGQMQNIAYIGESEDVRTRLNFHMSDDKGKGSKEYWLDTIVLVSSDDYLTKAHVRFAEAKLMVDASNNPLWKLANTKLTNGAKQTKVPKLPIAAESTMLRFVRDTHTLTRALGCSLFKPTIGKQITQSPNLDQSSKDSPEFRFSGKGFDAKAVESGQSGEWIVRKHSAAKVTEADSLSPGIKKLREQLKDNGVLVESNGVLVFQEDCAFRSPSAAAGVVCGSPTSGRTAWKLENGTLYSDWESDKRAGLIAGSTGTQTNLPI
ncbi:MAG: GIY-YIG nuclease family protein [Thiobacillus sp.]|nr:GIY-YIG nuclease family protein [Thiobacillus sp.]